jgi:hypothetical protein
LFRKPQLAEVKLFVLEGQLKFDLVPAQLKFGLRAHAEAVASAMQMAN